jgi:hypothetical protein
MTNFHDATSKETLNSIVLSICNSKNISITSQYIVENKWGGIFGIIQKKINYLIEILGFKM